MSSRMNSGTEDFIDSLDADAVRWSVPVSERAGRPLLVMMHGWSYDETHLYDLLVPRLPSGLVAASVRAPIAEAGGYAWFPSRGNPIGDPRPDVANARVDAVLQWLDGQPGFSSVGLVGFSQGGAMVLQLMRRAPERFAYGIQLAGFVVGDAQDGDADLAEIRRPVFWGRGGRDHVIPRKAIERTSEWMKQYTDATIRVYSDLNHDVAGKEIDDVLAFVGSQVSAHL